MLVPKGGTQFEQRTNYWSPCHAAAATITSSVAWVWVEADAALQKWSGGTTERKPMHHDIKSDATDFHVARAAPFKRSRCSRRNFHPWSNSLPDLIVDDDLSWFRDFECHGDGVGNLLGKSTGVLFAVDRNL